MKVSRNIGNCFQISVHEWKEYCYCQPAYHTLLLSHFYEDTVAASFRFWNNYHTFNLKIWKSFTLIYTPAHKFSKWFIITFFFFIFVFLDLCSVLLTVSNSIQYVCRTFSHHHLWCKYCVQCHINLITIKTTKTCSFYFCVAWLGFHCFFFLLSRSRRILRIILIVFKHNLQYCNPSLFYKHHYLFESFLFTSYLPFNTLHSLQIVNQLQVL